MTTEKKEGSCPGSEDREASEMRRWTGVLTVEQETLRQASSHEQKQHPLLQPLLSLTKLQRKSSGKEHLLGDKHGDTGKGDITGVLWTVTKETGLHPAGKGSSVIKFQAAA